MTRKALPAGLKTRLLVLALWKELRIGSLRELIKLVKALTMSASGRNDEMSNSYLTSKLHSMAEVGM